MASITGGRLAVILTIIGLIGTLISAYIIYLAKASPSPPQLGGAGPALAVSWCKKIMPISRNNIVIKNLLYCTLLS